MLPSSGRLPRRVHELRGCVAELLHAERAAAVLQQEIETRRGAKAGDRRNVERKDDRLRNLANCCCKLRHDAAHMQRPDVAFFPRLHPDEDRAEVRLVGAGDDAVAADGLRRNRRPSVLARICSTCASTALVRSSDAPAAA